MSTQILDELKKRREQREEKGMIHQQKVAFLAIKTEVEKAMNAGYTLKEIHSLFVEMKSINCKYETFLGYVRTHIKNKDKTSPLPKTSEPGNVSNRVKPDRQKREPIVARSIERKFIFNPTPNPDELI